MIVGVAIGACVDGVQEAFDTVRFHDVSVREFCPPLDDTSPPHRLS
jgi:hypothetical protein